MEIKSPVSLAERLYETHMRESVRFGVYIQGDLTDNLGKNLNWPMLSESIRLVWDAVAKEAERAINGH